MKIKDLFKDKSNWTKCANARTKEGKAVCVTSPHAASWCLLGACFKVYGSSLEATDKFRHQVNYYLKRERTAGVTNWNDAPERTFEEIYKLVNDLDI